ELDEAGIQNGVATPDHGHIAFVKIAERRWRGTSRLTLCNHVAHEVPLLHGPFRDPRPGGAILPGWPPVPRDGDPWIARHTAIRLHAYASGPVGRRLQPGARW